MFKSNLNFTININWGDVTFLDGLTNVTFFAVASLSTNADNYASLIRKDGTFTPVQRNASVAQFHTVIWTPSLGGETTNLSYTSNEIIRISGRRSGTSYVLRKDGSQTSFTCGSSALPGVVKPLMFFSNESNGEKWRETSLCEVAFWNVSLTDDEIVSLEKGFKPSRIRPSALIFYSPLIRDVVELKSATSHTKAGVEHVPHPRMI